MSDTETLVRWLVKMQLAEISGIVHDKSRSQEIRGLYFAALCEGTELMYGKERAEEMLDSMTDGKYTELKEATKAGATDAELDAIVGIKKGMLQ